MPARKRETREVDGVTEAKCSTCGEWKPLNADHYKPLPERSASHLAFPFLARCRQCENAYQRQKWATSSPGTRENVRRNSKARQRALAELAKRHPDEFDDLLAYHRADLGCGPI